MALRILVVDDHDVVRQGVRLILRDRPDWRNRSSHVPFLSRHVEVNTRPEDFVAGLFFGLNLFEELRRLVKHA